MKNIVPIDVWVNGETKQSTQLTLTIKFDNLETEAVFNYVLSDDSNNALVTGTLAIEGTDYQTWGQSTDANSDAYLYAANKLNLTFV